MSMERLMEAKGLLEGDMTPTMMYHLYKHFYAITFVREI
ncbi:hypothetical protein JCM19233_853 [Vibrio astriarenae]|nr:hypothetical protein JCM19233_853 [Vibrio sp. C7]